VIGGHKWELFKPYDLINATLKPLSKRLDNINPFYAPYLFNALMTQNVSTYSPTSSFSNPYRYSINLETKVMDWEKHVVSNPYR